MVYCDACGKSDQYARSCRCNKKRNRQNGTSDDQKFKHAAYPICDDIGYIAVHSDFNVTYENIPYKQRRAIQLSMLFDQVTNVEKCKICKKLKHTKECPFGDPEVNVQKHLEDHIPQVDLYLDKEKQGCRLAIDKDSEVSVLKMKIVPPDVPIVSDDTVQLQTSLKTKVPHLGKICIDVFDYPMLFYVVSDDIGIRCDGVLGMDFFSTVPTQWLDGFLIIKGEKYPVFQFDNNSIIMPPRSCVTDYVNVLTSDIKVGYIPPLIFGTGIFAGHCIVSMKDKKSYLLFFNYTKYEIEVTRPCVELESTKSVNVINISSNIDIDSYMKSISHLLRSKSNYEGVFEFISKDRIQEVLGLLHLNHLDDEELEAVIRWIENYDILLHLSRDKLSVSYDVMHKITCKDDVPVKCEQISLSEKEKVEMKKVINELLDQGIIRVSESPYDSPAYVIRDKTDSHGNEKWKLIVDYSKLNENIKDDAYPIPCALDILNSFGRAQYFSVLNLASGYHQIQMNPDDVHKTAFSTPDGHFEFKRLPAGLKNAGATFQRHLDKVLYELRNSVHCYLDSIIVYSKTLKNHEEILTRLATKFTEVNLKLQPDQCEFFRKEVIYLE